MSDRTNKTLYVFFICAQAGQLSDITPEAIKAQDGDTGINEAVVYSITAGTVNRRFTTHAHDMHPNLINKQ